MYMKKHSSIEIDLTNNLSFFKSIINFPEGFGNKKQCMALQCIDNRFISRNCSDALFKKCKGMSNYYITLFFLVYTLCQNFHKYVYKTVYPDNC